MLGTHLAGAESLPPGRGLVTNGHLCALRQLPLPPEGSRTISIKTRPPTRLPNHGD